VIAGYHPARREFSLTEGSTGSVSARQLLCGS
jgi:hypothetical protein